MFEEAVSLPSRIGATDVQSQPASRVLNRATGFVKDYDYTLNPYLGCQFGCAYCYAVFFVQHDEQAGRWGHWVYVKTNALAQLNRCRNLAGKRIYMSTVTDPYQPVEARLGLTRSLLESMVPESRQPRLVVQTRSALVTRDIDLFRKFQRLRVNVTVTTDSENVRKRFEPGCPSIGQRLEALETLKRAGIKTSVCLTPLLPIEEPDAFARTLASLKADIYVAQPFHANRGRFASGTRQTALDLARDFNWNLRSYESAVRILTRHLPHIYEGQAGFFPE